MKRRQFLKTSSLACSGFALSPLASGATKNAMINQPSSFRLMTESLLKDWCDGMLAHQIDDPKQPERDGALWCPACQKIHGRCMDAVYPFTHMAAKTGDERYLEGAKKVMRWSNNVSLPNGAWTVIPDPKSWAGITVFGAIAVAEALHFHGGSLPQQLRQTWTERLERAIAYVYREFDLTFTNVNYGFTGIYALNLCGHLLKNKTYIARSRELAAGAKRFFTQPNHLIWGEGKPIDVRSAKGLLAVDLGYNVEETLNGLVLYAMHENDKELLALLSDSMMSHLQFMLPDGSWDNSWGTRQFKWSYWGSRTTDGCQPAFASMAKLDPAFGSAAYLSTDLLRRCTDNGLLHGGLHYTQHHVLPCIHHTFAHAKPLAYVLDSGIDLSEITRDTPVPRQTSSGVTHFPEIDVSLFAGDEWRGTVSTYDAIYKKYVQQASGGSIGMLWHDRLGPIMAASLAEYILVEANNQQFDPDGEDIALTPRVEHYQGESWYTNLYDLQAEMTHQDKDGVISFDITTELRNRERKTPSDGPMPIRLNYRVENGVLSIKAQRLPLPSVAEKSKTSGKQNVRLTLPIISSADEKVVQAKSGRIEIDKRNARLVLDANAPLSIRKTKRSRVFNMVPGFQAIVVDITIPNNTNNANNAIECRLFAERYTSA